MSPLDDQKIAVIIPAYNCESSIERAVLSAVNQDLPDAIQLDVIVVDDCSTDQTPNIVADMVAAYAPHLQLLRQPQNGGPSAARNAALRATNAAWFTPLDSDDFMAPDRLSKLYTAAQQGLWQFVADNLLITDSETPQTVIRTLWPDKPTGLVKMSLSFFVQHNLTTYLDRSELGYVKPLIDRRQRPDIIDLYRSEMRFGEDYDLYARLLANGARACLIDACGYYAVQRSGSLSRTPTAIDFERLIVTDTDLLQRPNLTREDHNEIWRHRREVEHEWVWVRAIEAVRAKRPLAFLSCFFVSPTASWALCGKLLSHFVSKNK